ncbi:hypothetical protein PTSG_01680 [Salpingoeca rosetta]|uniref:Uncharacterized protein n=1 Tax=Salpingoeca rosetta (strain ATCC 50818 / BSB-021) TaxID=946362 RepID=F2TYM7_SALR5|nr:uncharacterized protein PTSG_01680 [Salpingoeca rosetta]EGD78701.1 hypothetical protein PTSG_01680 [Salpingoeca rosetta]|eukprot:XP_004997658.1 hypothetical protein PTSG_01680 [Salpingoeca rosetta]
MTTVARATVSLLLQHDATVKMLVVRLMHDFIVTFDFVETEDPRWERLCAAVDKLRSSSDEFAHCCMHSAVGNEHRFAHPSFSPVCVCYAARVNTLHIRTTEPLFKPQELSGLLNLLHLALLPVFLPTGSKDVPLLMTTAGGTAPSQTLSTLHIQSCLSVCLVALSVDGYRRADPNIFIESIAGVVAAECVLERQVTQHVLPFAKLSVGFALVRRAPWASGAILTDTHSVIVHTMYEGSPLSDSSSQQRDWIQRVLENMWTASARGMKTKGVGVPALRKEGELFVGNLQLPEIVTKWIEQRFPRCQAHAQMHEYVWVLTLLFFQPPRTTAAVPPQDLSLMAHLDSPHIRDAVVARAREIRTRIVPDMLLTDGLMCIARSLNDVLATMNPGSRTGYLRHLLVSTTTPSSRLAPTPSPAAGLQTALLAALQQVYSRAPGNPAQQQQPQAAVQPRPLHTVLARGTSVADSAGSRSATAPTQAPVTFVEVKQQVEQALQVQQTQQVQQVQQPPQPTQRTQQVQRPQQHVQQGTPKDINAKRKKRDDPEDSSSLREWQNEIAQDDDDDADECADLLDTTLPGLESEDEED